MMDESSMTKKLICKPSKQKCKRVGVCLSNYCQSDHIRPEMESWFRLMMHKYNPGLNDYNEAVPRHKPISGHQGRSAELCDRGGKVASLYSSGGKRPCLLVLCCWGCYWLGWSYGTVIRNKGLASVSVSSFQV